VVVHDSPPLHSVVALAEEELVARSDQTPAAIDMGYSIALSAD